MSSNVYIPPPISRRAFDGDADLLHYLYWKTLYWHLIGTFGPERRNAKRFGSRIPTILNRLNIFESVPGQEAAALGVEVVDRWDLGVEHRRLVIKKIKRLRFLASVGSSNERRIARQVYAPAKLSSAYDLLAHSQYRDGQSSQAKKTLLLSREICTTNRIPFRGAQLLTIADSWKLNDGRISCDTEVMWRNRFIIVYNSYGGRSARGAF